MQCKCSSDFSIQTNQTKCKKKPEQQVELFCSQGSTSNNAKITLVNNGLLLELPDNQSRPPNPTIQTPLIPLSNGFYNKASYGNKIVLGFNAFDGRNITDFISINIQGTILTSLPALYSSSDNITNPNMYVNLFLKNTINNCSFWRSNNPLSDDNDSLIVGDNLLSTYTNNTDFNLTAYASDSVWYIVNYGTNPTSYHGLEYLIGGQPKPLTSFSTTQRSVFFPAPTDNGIPIFYNCGCIALCIGDSSTLTPASVLLKKLSSHLIIEYKNTFFNQKLVGYQFSFFVSQKIDEINFICFTKLVSSISFFVNEKLIFFYKF